MHDYRANKTICNEAHVTLQLFLSTLSSDLKPLQYKVCSSLIMKNCFDNVYIYFLDFSKYNHEFTLRNYEVSTSK